MLRQVYIAMILAISINSLQLPSNYFKKMKKVSEYEECFAQLPAIGQTIAEVIRSINDSNFESLIPSLLELIN